MEKTTLVSLAKEFNAVMNLEKEDRLNVSAKADEKALVKDIRSLSWELTSADFIQDGEDHVVFSEEAKLALIELGIKIPEPVKEKKEAAKKERVPQYTRHHAFVEAFKALSGKTKPEIVQLSDELYNAKHPDSKAAKGKKKATDAGSIAELQFRFSMPTLLLLGIAEQVENVFNLTVPATNDEEVIVE